MVQAALLISLAQEKSFILINSVTRGNKSGISRERNCWSLFMLAFFQMMKQNM